MSRKLVSLSTSYLKALLYSYGKGFEEAVAKYGLVPSEFKSVYEVYGDRLGLADFRHEIIDILFGRGVSPEEISENIVWRDFEYLVYRFFDGYGYGVSRNVRIPGYRYEVDLVVRHIVSKYCLVIECKRWGRVLHPSRVRDIVAGLVNKSILLKESYSSKCSGLVPVIVTMRRGRLVFHDGVPIIPINFLKDFIDNLSYFIYAGEVRLI